MGLTVALASGLGFCALICGFPEAVEITTRPDLHTYIEWGGIEVLFLLFGLASGWISPVCAEKKWEGSTLSLSLIASAWCLVGAAAGLLLVRAFRGGLPVGSWEMALGMIAGSAIGILGWVLNND
jgi:hypothetical protein